MSSSTATAPARKGPEAKLIRPTELMQECGSKNGQWHPESPEQWRWSLTNTDGPERALAWIKLASIARGSAVCVNAAGARLRAEHMAADLEWSLKTAKNVCAVLAAEGRIRILRGAAIAYRADVPEIRRIEGEGRSRVHGQLLTSAEREILAGRPKEEQERYYADEQLLVKYENQIHADAIALTRESVRPLRDEFFTAHRFERKLALEQNEKPRAVKIEVLVEPPLFSFELSRVQGSPAYAPETGLYRGEETVGKRAASLLGFSSSLAKPKESVSQSPPGPTDRHAAAPDSEAHAAAAPGTKQIAAIKSLLLEEYGRRFPGEIPSSHLCVQIISALAGAPLDLLQVQIRQRMRSSTSMGFALKLAEDVAARWKEDAPARAKAAAAGAEHAHANRAETKALCEETLADPRASVEEKELAREVLKSMAAAGGA